MSVSDPVHGVWREAGAAAATPARIDAAADGTLTVRTMADGRELARQAMRSVEISARVGTIARHVSFMSGGDFETTDNDGIDRLRDLHLGSREGLIHELERFRPRLLVFVALTIALCFAIYRYAVPVLVEVAVLVTPPAVTDLMGKSVLISLDQFVFEETKLSDARRNALDAQFRALVAAARVMPAASGAGPAYALNFRGGGQIGPNAFALPDGSVVVTDELVDLASDDEMIMGVLAHEIGHVEHQHSLRQIYRVAGVTALIMLIGGDIGAATEDLLTQGATLVALSHSRAAETEADRYSVQLMHRTGQDPAAIARFFELLRDKFGLGGDVTFLSTHPATQKRIDETRRYAEEVQAGGQ